MDVQKTNGFATGRRIEGFRNRPKAEANTDGCSFPNALSEKDGAPLVLPRRTALAFI